MRKVAIFCFFALSLTMCTQKQATLHIQGNIDSEKDFQNEWLYLISMDAHKNFVVDSARIQNQKFNFTVQVCDSFHIARIAPKIGIQSYWLQPLVVVVEPGDLSVTLSQNSSSSGTLLNDKLDFWKKMKQTNDATFSSIVSKYRNATTETEKEDYKKRIEERRLINTEFNYNFVKENKDNELGRFFYTMIKGTLSEDQIKSLSMEDNEAKTQE